MGEFVKKINQINIVKLAHFSDIIPTCNYQLLFYNSLKCD